MSPPVLISEPYRALNAAQHETAEYGTSGHLSAPYVEQLAAVLNTRSVLDYGCGKRTLAHALPFAIESYDPCIEGLDAPPAPADIVVCGDVLEHVEPDCLDAVLDDIQRVTLDTTFLAIATGPAQNYYPDGRNTHLIQQPIDWWIPQLEKRFATVRYWQTQFGFVYFGRAFAKQFQPLDLSHIGPAVETREIKVRSVYSDDQRCANIRSAMLRGLPTVVPLPAHDKIMILACYGPSLIDSIPRLKREKGDIFTVSGAHDVLLGHGVVPAGHIESDPRPHKAKLVTAPHQDICYLLSSACDRAVFDNLQNAERWLFHVTSSPAETDLIASMERTRTFTIDGGTNVGMSAIGLGTVLGYRKFSIHGMDFSFRASDDLLNWPRDREFSGDMRRMVECHAGQHPNEDQMLCRVWVGDRPFVTSPQMLQGAQDFLATRTVLPHCRFQIHGDGYLKALLGHINTLNHRRAA